MDIKQLKNNETDRKLLYHYLLLVDADFSPCLSQKADLEKLSLKILSMGNAYVCRDTTHINGLITFYNNDSLSRCSYCSILSVLRDKRGLGIASMLLDVFIGESLRTGMRTATVHTNNEFALNLYLKKEFNIQSVDDSVSPKRYFLTKNL